MILKLDSHFSIFLKFDKIDNVIRDHPSHGSAVLAGMWGAKLEESDFRDIIVGGMEKLLQEANLII